jgi:hypothetical protein
LLATLVVGVSLIYLLGPSFVSTILWEKPKTLPIHVWDNVLSNEAMAELHRACLDRRLKRGSEASESVRFPWPTPDIHRRNAVEQVLSSILDELHSTHTTTSTSEEEPVFFVEYWDRQEWMSIDAHADQDEVNFNKALETGLPAMVRHPIYGHVLYLNHQDAPFLRPTLVFANTSTGGDLVTAASRHDIEMFVVPNLPGRLLRFQGHLLHAVPRPADMYVNSPPPNTHLERLQRNVILFNLWPAKDPPGIDVTIPNKDETEQVKISNLCHDQNKWHSPPISRDYQSDSVWDSAVRWKHFWLPLMGVEAQRGTKAKRVILNAGRSVEQALQNPTSDPLPKRVFLSGERPTWNGVITRLLLGGEETVSREL